MTNSDCLRRGLLVLGLLLALSGCGGTKQQDIVGTWKFTDLNSSDTITFDEQGGVEWKRPGGWPKEGTSPGFPVSLAPLFQSGGRGNWELTQDGKLRIYGKRPDGTEWSKTHDYRIDDQSLVLPTEGETFLRVKN